MTFLKIKLLFTGERVHDVQVLKYFFEIQNWSFKLIPILEGLANKG